MLFSFDGLVQHGNGKGHSFGFPTLNVPLPHGLAVDFGVYLSRVTKGDRVVYGLTNVGVHPTVGRMPEPITETFLFCDDCNWYAEKVRIELLRFLRREEHFSSVGKLKDQIALDVTRAKEILKNEKSV